MKTTSKLRPLLIGMMLLAILIPGCVVLSFYPLYEEDDLFHNNLLVGKWMDKDSTVWSFDHPFEIKDKIICINDSAGYKLELFPLNGFKEKSELEVNIIKLGDDYFLDFYLEDYGPMNDKQREEFMIVDLHILRVHTFAKMTHWGDSIKIEWFDPEWLEEQFKQNRVRIHHENNGENILLTAKPAELKQFILKYGKEQDAFGLDVTLFLQHKD